jgi:hypothetical protein
MAGINRSAAIATFTRLTFFICFSPQLSLSSYL